MLPFINHKIVIEENRQFLSKNRQPFAENCDRNIDP
jgi:hypothetical protein